jgi:hypothetical protein
MPTTYPFNDNDLTYDFNTHRYTLTKQYMLNNGMNLDELLESTGDANKNTLPARFLRRVSDLVYEHIYSFNHDMLAVEYELAKNPQVREKIKRVLLEQAMYMISNGDLTIESGISILELRYMNTSKIMSAGLSAQVEKMLANLGILNVRYNGNRLYNPSYEGDGY